MTDEALARIVVEELSGDPKTDAAGIAVSASNGAVTLRGTVGSLRTKREARKAAERARGVVSVDDQLRVDPLVGARRGDAELRADVLQALMLDSHVPASVDVRVWDGRVTLTGLVDWQYQRDEAESVAGNLPAVLELVNHIELNDTTHVAGDVERNVRSAFVRNAKLHSGDLVVATSDGRVVLTGTVRSWDEHDAALTAAWSAPGVRAVEDQLTVTS